MLSLVLGVALSASPNLAAPGLQCAGVEPVLCDAYLEHFVGNLTSRGVKVTTRNDMSQVLGVARQKQLLGCSSDTSCLVELAGALGVAALLAGTVAKTESGYLSTLKVIDATDGSTKWSATRRVDSEKELFAFFEDQAAALAGTIAPDAAAKGGAPVVKWIPAMVGGVAAIVGGVLFAEAAAEAAVLREQIRNPEPLSKVASDNFTVEQDIRSAAEAGRTFQTAGWLCVGLGAAAIASSFLWWLLTPSSPVTATFLPSPNGALVGVTLELP